MSRLSDFMTHYNVTLAMGDGVSAPEYMQSEGVAKFLSGQVGALRLPELVEESLVWNTNTMIDEEIPLKIQPLRCEFDSARATGDFYDLFQQVVTINFFGAIRKSGATVDGSTQFGKLTHSVRGRIIRVMEQERRGGQINLQTVGMTGDHYEVKFKPSGGSENTLITIDRDSDTLKRANGEDIWKGFREALGV